MTEKEMFEVQVLAEGKECACIKRENFEGKRSITHTNANIQPRRR
jgi:hypothetical protein